MIKNQRGVSLIITLFIMIIILAVVLSVSTLLYSQVKVIRDSGNSVVSFYAADSGIEKVLYYDWQVVPAGAVRGLCAIAATPPSCIPDPSTTASGDHSIFCNSLLCMLNACRPAQYTGGSVCSVNNCSDCTVDFYTTFDSRNYHVTATVGTVNGINYYSYISSKGSFGGAQRTIEITAPLTP